MSEVLDFRRYTLGTLFLIRTPETFPEGYAEQAFADMRRLHLEYAAWLETWNCFDGIIWKHPDYPRSSYWKDCDRDPLEETFCAADRNGIAFLPECGVICDDFMEAHRDAMHRTYEGMVYRGGRAGLVPAAEVTADYLIAKYDALIGKFGSHPSFRGLCMPAENRGYLTYDPHTEKAWRRATGTPMPSPAELYGNPALLDRMNAFLEETFLTMYRRIARHLRQKYDLPLMHYPLSKVSALSHHEPNVCYPDRNLEAIAQVGEIDLLNLQLHPPLGNHPRQFKLEIELLEGLTDKPCVADTHWYHEFNAGKLPDLAPKRSVDWILSTLTPWGISFFCYGFMAAELPLWKKELNPGAPVFDCYADPEVTALRRREIERGMEFAERLRPYLDGTRHTAAAAIFYRETLDHGYQFGNYYREHLFSCYEGIQAAAVPLCVTREIPASPEAIRCLIFDAVKEFSDADANRLRAYLAAGGRAVVVGKCAPELYAACGLSVRACAGEFVTAGSEASDRWSFSIPVDSEKLTAEGETLFCYNRGDGAVVRRGNVVFVGCWSAVSRFEDFRQRGIVKAWRRIFRELDALGGVDFSGDHRGAAGDHEYISCDIFADEKRGRRVLLIRNFGVEALSSRLAWELPAGYEVRSALADGCAFRRDGDGELPPFSYFILLEAARPVAE